MPQKISKRRSFLIALYFFLQPITSRKVDHILDIWNDDLGVVVVQCFHNIIPVEAYTREGCMISALGELNMGVLMANSPQLFDHDPHITISMWKPFKYDSFKMSFF